jgi:hypothetical protein
LSNVGITLINYLKFWYKKARIWRAYVYSVR